MGSRVSLVYLPKGAYLWEASVLAGYLLAKIYILAAGLIFWLYSQKIKPADFRYDSV